MQYLDTNILGLFTLFILISRTVLFCFRDDIIRYQIDIPSVSAILFSRISFSSLGSCCTILILYLHTAEVSKLW